MAISAETVKELRDKTGVSVMECKKALEQADGNMDKALEILKARSAEIAAKKGDRTLGAGAVQAYIHNTAQIGAMVLLSCETDFVSKHEEFMTMARDIAMHASAMRPADVAELMGQTFIKDPSLTIEQLLSQGTAKFGERIEITSMVVFSVK